MYQDIKLNGKFNIEKKVPTATYCTQRSSSICASDCNKEGLYQGRILRIFANLFDTKQSLILSCIPEHEYFPENQYNKSIS